jgi:hypothetical protein
LSDGQGLEAELRRELHPAHQLYRCKVRAIARRQSCDDVLFADLPEERPLFLVHLTWHPATDAKWPHTVSYNDMDEFLERWPREEARDFPDDAG